MQKFFADDSHTPAGTGLRKDALRIGPRKDAGCEWRMSVGRLRPAGPADITKQTRNFQALKLSIRRNLSPPAGRRA